MNHFDAMGSLPKWVVKKGTTVNLNQTVRLFKIIEKDIEEFRAAEKMTNETFEIWAPLASTESTKKEEDDEKTDTNNNTDLKNVDLPPKIASQVERTLKNCIDMAAPQGGKYCKKWLDFGGKDGIEYHVSEDYAFKEGIAIKGT